MTALSSFDSAMTVAVIGASGGIGSALCERLSEDTQVASLYAFSRKPAESAGKTIWHPIDIADESSIEFAITAVGDIEFDLVIVPTGILHAGAEIQPERRMSDLNAATLSRVLAVNAIGPALVAKHFLPRLRRGTKSVFAALSARVGSISDNRLGGWASYRASKAALNQLLRTLSIEHARRWPDSAVVALHPGTVDTGLSKPFTSRTPEDKLFSPRQAAEYLLRVIDGLTAEDSGGFFAWDGSAIDY
ncbi:MAG: SDR family NAD(P)-dependent oxidoreductase [Woeseiaceae bacterium]|nr:SDR family NAD(P)-dependent oxidoreductase [Woeseiaceae bacterium]